MTGRFQIAAKFMGGPAFLECKMVRFFGHFEGDAQTYRAKGENEENRANKDCLKIFRSKVTKAGVISDAELNKIDDQVLARIEASVQKAKKDPLPTAKDLLTDVYVSY